jgi:hypothetical protein
LPRGPCRWHRPAAVPTNTRLDLLAPDKCRQARHISGTQSRLYLCFGLARNLGVRLEARWQSRSTVHGTGAALNMSNTGRGTIFQDDTCVSRRYACSSVGRSSVRNGSGEKLTCQTSADESYSDVRPKDTALHQCTALRHCQIDGADQTTIVSRGALWADRS